MSGATEIYLSLAAREGDLVVVGMVECAECHARHLSAWPVGAGDALECALCGGMTAVFIVAHPVETFDGEPLGNLIRSRMAWSALDTWQHYRRPRRKES